MDRVEQLRAEAYEDSADKKSTDTFCACCGSPASDRFWCEGCERWVCPSCLLDVEILVGGKFYTEPRCSDCILKDRADSVRDSVSLIFPCTAKAKVEGGYEFTFSPEDSDDFKVIVKR